MANITVNDTPTQITDGNETSDTLVMVGKSMRSIVGSPAGRTYDDAMPTQWGQIIIVPSGVVFNLVCVSGKSYPAWRETGFSA